MVSVSVHDRKKMHRKGREAELDGKGRKGRKGGARGSRKWKPEHQVCLFRRGGQGKREARVGEKGER